ncbi:beta-mannosidase [Anaeramoeba ignava]|uniref:Beta-mannosidase B n=1 Tax=Anaeramoeba ignava TaxID=1746090 RepID=A0A9Q0REY1_ANAIG|nr:beta-mannosidase [Anaeramoeba ignava]
MSLLNNYFLNKISILFIFQILFIFSFTKCDIKVYDLSGDWKLTNNNNVTLTAKLPGSVQMSLYYSQIIENPIWRFGDTDTRWIAFQNWVYSRSLTLDSDFINNQKIVLEFDGIDTIAQITINQVNVTMTSNQFRLWRIDVTDFLHVGDNEMTITFFSPTDYVNEQAASYPYLVPGDTDSVINYYHGEKNRQFIRKAQCHFGWDWGPCLLPIGIHRSLQLISYQNLLINKTQINQYRKTQTTYEIEAKINLMQITTGSVTLTLDQFTQKKEFDSKQEIEIKLEVESPELWWPNGYGSQKLYELEIKVESGEETQEITKKIGFRHIELVEEPVSNSSGLSFYFRINDVPIFAKGSNFIPLDSFEGVVTKEVYDNFFESAIAANWNMMRVWGGGVYETDYFYDKCDEKGIMIMQDFMFACSMYPRNAGFLTEISGEIEDQIYRLSHHASIIVWSGNNENEAALSWWDPIIENPRLYVVDYSKLYLDTMRPIVFKLDPNRTFLSSSPSNGVLSSDPYVLRWGNPQNESYGDVHFYDYTMDCLDVSNYPSPRFASEFGFQSVDSIYSWQQCSVSEDWDIYSPLFEHRQHHPLGTFEMLGQIEMHFPFSYSNASQFESFIYLSQVTQAICMQTETEHYRRLKSSPHKTYGTLYWQASNDWVAPSWSSLEHFGRWKILHYFAANFYSSVIVSPYESAPDELSVYVVSDLLVPIQNDRFSLELWSWNGSLLYSDSLSYSVQPLDSILVYKRPISSILSAVSQTLTRQDCFLHFSARNSSNLFFLSSFYNVTLTPKIHFS